LATEPKLATAGAADPGIDDHDFGALFRHQLGDLGAHAARRAGADRHFPLKHARHLRVPPNLVDMQLTRPRAALSIRRQRPFRQVLLLKQLINSKSKPAQTAGKRATPACAI